MKAVIIYDSLFGNTEKIGMAIRDEIGSENEARLLKATEAAASDISGAGLLIIGSPTHGGRFTEPVKIFFNSLPEGSLQGVKAAAFDTGAPLDGQTAFVRGVIRFFGYASVRISRELEKKGADLIDSETFFVLDREGPLKEGEIERAKEWAAMLLKKNTHNK